MKGLQNSALSVSAVALFISDLVKNQLGALLIRGEISNLQLRKHSAYIRFSLKDDKAKIDCLTHSSTNAAALLSKLKDGDEVIVFANPSYYTKYGQISFFTDEIMKLGAGLFQSALEELRHRLYEEGLFDPSRKKPLPSYPSKIGVVTSADGAALQDIIRVAQDRYPWVEIFVYPSLVQGADAPESLVKALSKALDNKNLDAIIIGRGGGSSEDLDAFNYEPLIRLVSSGETPIIAAVGHETDTTLIDYAADASAPTPTGAAMMILPDKKELISETAGLKEQLSDRFKNMYREEFIDLDNTRSRLFSGFKHSIEIEKQKEIHNVPTPKS